MTTPQNQTALMPLPLTILILAMVPFVARSDSGPAPRADQFDQLQALIKPHPGEDKWAEIPWTTDLWDARKRANDLGKPILLWEMDGNPLGCG
jgi:hypothetical protein